MYSTMVCTNSLHFGLSATIVYQASSSFIFYSSQPTKNNETLRLTLQLGSRSSPQGNQHITDLLSHFTTPQLNNKTECPALGQDVCTSNTLAPSSCIDSLLSYPSRHFSCQYLHKVTETSLQMLVCRPQTTVFGIRTNNF